MTMFVLVWFQLPSVLCAVRHVVLSQYPVDKKEIRNRLKGFLRSSWFSMDFVVLSLYLSAHLGRDTLASGSRFGRVWDEIRSHAGRCAPKSISDGTGRPDGLPRIDEKLMQGSWKKCSLLMPVNVDCIIQSLRCVCYEARITFVLFCCFCLSGWKKGNDRRTACSTIVSFLCFCS